MEQRAATRTGYGLPVVHRARHTPDRPAAASARKGCPLDAPSPGIAPGGAYGTADGGAAATVRTCTPTASERFGSRDARSSPLALPPTCCRLSGKAGAAFARPEIFEGL
jgi:hypothetical protein